MALIPVRFVYLTGLKRDIFRNVRLSGSWDAAGRYSTEWTITPMQPVRGEDDCPCFEATVQLDDSQVGVTFRWGVLADTAEANNLWAIVTEVRDESSARHRFFTLQATGAAGPQEERYYLTHCRWLGAQKHYRPGAAQPGVRFAVWAPNARAVEVVFGEFDPDRRERQTGYIADDGTGVDPALGPFALQRRAGGVWETDPAAELADFSRFDHRPYMFRITRDDGGVRYRTDLYSRCQIGKGRIDPGGSPYTGHYTELDGSKGCSVVIDPDTVAVDFANADELLTDFAPAEEFWRDEIDRSRPLPQRVEDLVIYELHVGSLGYGQPRPGHFGDVIGLLDYLVDLGVNAIQLMPVLEFEGDEQWGYGTSHYFALEFSAGGRDQLKHLVRACHRRGVAVILDVVYNHYHHRAERAEWAYDSPVPERNIYYWYEGRASDYPAYEAAAAANPDQTPPGQGGYIDNMSTGYAPRYYEEMVRQMMISSAAALVEDFHIDGFRVDQTTSIHAYNGLHADGRSVGSANIFGAKFLREFSRLLKMIHPRVMLIAEDHSEWERVTQSPDQDGLGFDAAWYANFYHHLIGDQDDRGPSEARLLKMAGYGGNEPLAMDYFAGPLGSSGNRKVVYSESHDEAGNARGTHRTIVVAVNGAALQGETRRYAEARCRVAFGLTMLSAGSPMFFMGEEIGAARDIRYRDTMSSREDLFGERRNNGARLFAFYSDLIKFRLQRHSLRSHQIDIVHIHNGNRILAFRRWDGVEELLVVASFNNMPFEHGYIIRNPRLGNARWTEIFNSDASLYGGANIGNGGAILPSSNEALDIIIPANSVLVFQRQ